jgi:hypothetical protein
MAKETGEGSGTDVAVVTEKLPRAKAESPGASSLRESNIEPLKLIVPSGKWPGGSMIPVAELVPTVAPLHPPAPCRLLRITTLPELSDCAVRVKGAEPIVPNSAVNDVTG